jgi:hypothetical protein
MTGEELDAVWARLGLDIPEAERGDIAGAAHFIAEMTALLRKPRAVGAEPAHTVAFPDNAGEG